MPGGGRRPERQHAGPSPSRHEPPEVDGADAHSSTRGRSFETFLCLHLIGVRVGFPSPKLMAQVPKGQRAKLGAVWISTSNPRYRLHGVRVHMTLSAARRHLAAGNLLHVGANDWYLAAAGSVTAVLKVRNGMVGEVGIAPRRFTLTVQQQRAFMRSFS